MFDDLDTAEKKTEDEQAPADDEEKSSWWIGRWAHVIAGTVFCLLYLPFKDRFWSWQLAITLSYVVFMFCCTCGLSFQDSDDFFGNLAVPKYMVGLLVRQILIFALVCLFAYGWRHLIPYLPDWAKARAIRSLSLWQVGGLLLVYFVAIREAKWMAKKIKQQFPEIVEPLDSIRSG